MLSGRARRERHERFERERAVVRLRPDDAEIGFDGPPEALEVVGRPPQERRIVGQALRRGEPAKPAALAMAEASAIPLE